MSRISRVGVFAAVIAVLGITVCAGVSQAAPGSAYDGRSLRWDRFDVWIDNIRTADNLFDVTESYELTIEQGPFSFGTFELPMDRLEAIRDFRVYDGGVALDRACFDMPGTYCPTQENDTYSVQYFFRQPAQSGQQRSIRLEYTVEGALRSYEEGDQLYWVAVPGDRPFPVLDSRVVVVLPPDRSPEVTASYPDTWHESIEGNTVTWLAPGSLGNHGSVEVRVQYPHDARMKKPSWQTWYDIQRSYEDNYRPIVSLLLLAFSVLLTLGGVLFVLLRYLSHGRDPEALVVPEYLSEPPSDELPGVVGALVDEKVDMQDIMGTLLDLARREYLVIEQTETGGVMGMFEKTEFQFHRTNKETSDLRGHETTLLKGLFPGSRTDTKLSDLRTKFYTHIPAIKQQIYNELVVQGYFSRSPETTRNWWLWGGIGLIIVASVLFWLALGATVISSLIVVPPVGLGIVGAAAALASSYMPAKTAKGAQEAARWRAFRQYLHNIEKYTDLAQASDLFEAYIGYAVAFGMEQEWLRRFSKVLTAMPGWYYPTYLGGPWRGGYRRGHTGSGRGVGDIRSRGQEPQRYEPVAH